jgi:MerR family transcriptional regulator, thiopeptide resistance regulator
MSSAYRVHEFAELAGVTVRALYHYDRLGLLIPRRSEAGYRIYVEHDLERLEQIAALKFLGLPLRKIKVLLDRDPLQLPEALQLQRKVLEDKRRLLDRAIAAIENAENAMHSGKPADPALLKTIIEAVEMQTDTDFMKNYYAAEAWVKFKQRHRGWPGPAWTNLFRDIQTMLTQDPAGEQAQSLAARWRELRVHDAGGDPAIHQGLILAWNDRRYWPDAVQSQFAEFDLDAISAFIGEAFAAFRMRHFGEIAWSPELEPLLTEEAGGMGLASVGLASVDLAFKIEDALDQDPSGDRAQALAARWMEVVENKTGGPPQAKVNQEYESAIRRMNGWPRAIHRRLAGIDRHRVSGFILRALAVTTRE